MFEVRLRQIAIPYKIKEPLRITVCTGSRCRDLGEVTLVNGEADTQHLGIIRVSEEELASSGFACFCLISFEAQGRTKQVGKINIRPSEAGLFQTQLQECRIPNSKAVYLVQKRNQALHHQPTVLGKLPHLKKVQLQQPTVFQVKDQLTQLHFLRQFILQSKPQFRTGLHTFINQVQGRPSLDSKIADQLEVKRLKHQLLVQEVKLSAVQLRIQQLRSQLNLYSLRNSQSGAQQQLEEKDEHLRELRMQLTQEKERTENREQRVEQMLRELNREIVRLRGENQTLRVRHEDDPTKQRVHMEMQAQLQKKTRQCADQERVIAGLREQNQKLKKLSYSALLQQLTG